MGLEVTVGVLVDLFGDEEEVEGFRGQFSNRNRSLALAVEEAQREPEGTVNFYLRGIGASHAPFSSREGQSSDTRGASSLAMTS
jgi:hypothetical protein